MTAPRQLSEAQLMTNYPAVLIVTLDLGHQSLFV